MSTSTGQLTQVLRRLGRSPMFTSVAILTLALGIGSNTAIFSVVEGVLLKPLPYPEPDRLIGIWHTAPGVDIKNLNISPSQYFVLRDENRSFSNFGVYDGDRVTVTGVGEPETLHSLDVTYGLLPTLGVRPLLGRFFTEKDDLPDSPETVVLTYGYWQHRFGGDPSILSRQIRIDGKLRQIIGVTPAKFQFLDDKDIELFSPMRFDRQKTMLGNFSYQAVGRLKTGVTMEQANADAARLIPIVNRSFPAPPGFSAKLFEQARISPAYRPFKQEVIGDVGPTLWVLMGTIGAVLLIACANVANLLLVRVESRHTELAIRAALGASARRIAYELLYESVVIGLLGGVLGLALAFGALRLLISLAPAGLPRLQEIGIDGPVLLFALGISLFTGLLFGSVPVLKYAGAQIQTSLREGGRTLSQSRERHRARSILVVVQVALAMVLLISSGLMIRTFQALVKVEPGFTNPADLQTLTLSIPDTQVKDPEQVLRMQRDIAEALKQIPGVASVAITTAVPMNGNNSNDLLFARDRSYREGEIPPVRRFIHLSPGLFQTLGTRFVAGRDFTWDTADRGNAMIVSQNFALEYWGSAAAALHKQMRVRTSEPWREIVGVVEDVHQDGVDQKTPTTAYFPLLMNDFEGDKVSGTRYASFVIRSSRAGAASFLSEVRRAIWGINPQLPLARVNTLDTLFRRSMARTSFTLVLLMIAASMALLLGAIGLYGVIAYSVAQRTREIGIRIALGAPKQKVTGMFVRYGVVLAAIGCVTGVVTALLVRNLLSSVLYSVSPSDPITYISMFVTLLSVAALASYLPSRRAASVDPAIALRLE